MLAQLSEAYFLGGNIKLALDKINEALLMIDEYGDRYYEASAKIIKAKIHCRKAPLIEISYKGHLVK